VITDDKNLKIAEAESMLPVRFRREEAESFPGDLAGATIVQVGRLADDRSLEEGGLVIDYDTRRGVRRRLVLGFNEVAMWITYKGPRALTSAGASR